MTRTQTYWMDRLRRAPGQRLRYGAPGMPEKTADALIKAGVLRREWQNVFTKPGRSWFAFFVIPVETP